MPRHRRPRAALALRALSALLALPLAACASEPASDPRADSVAAAAAERARVDSLEAIMLVTVDTNLAPALNVDLARMERRESGLYVQDRRRGTGAVADSGKWVTVAYTTWLADGTVLDDTRKPGGEPQRVVLGFGRVVPAWEEGIRGMREGGRRLIVAPPSLGYGKAGRPGSVPRLATLVFDVELRKVH